MRTSRIYKSQFGYFENGQPRLQLPNGFWDDVVWRPDPDPSEREISIECISVRNLAGYITNPAIGLLITRQTVSVWFSRYQNEWPGVYKVNGKLYVQRAIARQMKDTLENSPKLIYAPPKPANGPDEAAPEKLRSGEAAELSSQIANIKERNRNAFKRLRQTLKAVQDEIRDTSANRTTGSNEAELRFCSRRLAAIEKWLQAEFGFQPAEREAGSPQ